MQIYKQEEKKGGKWEDRARLGVNLGFFPHHVKSVHLISSLTMGCVSPQFHCTLDNHFATVDDYEYPKATWQEKVHFKVAKAAWEEKDWPENTLTISHSMYTGTTSRVTDAFNIRTHSGNPRTCGNS
jgi:hypothetical protein